MVMPYCLLTGERCVSTGKKCLSMGERCLSTGRRALFTGECCLLEEGVCKPRFDCNSKSVGFSKKKKNHSL